MKESTRKTWRILLRIFFPIACIALLAFIFGNSLRTGEESTKQSSTIVAAVQTVAGVIAPGSAIATATGEAYERLHGCVRVIAHFIEFAALGALMVWCCFAYTRKKRYLFIPFALIFLVPIIDETIQLFTKGRGAELFDVLVGTAGGVCGGLAAVGIACLIFFLLRAKTKKDETGLVKPKDYPSYGMYNE